MNSLKLLSTVTRHSQATKVFVRKINNQNLIPKVDFSWKEDKIIDTISKAAQSGGPGFFYLENHGIDSSVFENAIEQSNLFYSTTSMEQKEAITNHGYAGAPPGKSSKGKCLSKHRLGFLGIWIKWHYLKTYRRIPQIDIETIKMFLNFNLEAVKIY